MTSRRYNKDISGKEAIEAHERALRNLVEERIQAAMEAGAFDDLPGKGRPLPLDDNPFVPPELRLAYKVLADANFAPDWIEVDKKVRAARDELKAMQQRHVAWLRRRAEDLNRVQRDSGQPAPTITGETPRPAPGYEPPARDVLARHRHVRNQLKKRLEEINRTIDELNLIVPQLSLQRPRLVVADVLSDFDAACRGVYPGLDAW